MRRVLVLLAFLVLAAPAEASWDPLGGAVASGNLRLTTMAAVAGAPWVAVNDPDAKTITVSRWNGSAWESQGTPASGHDYGAMALTDVGGVAYVTWVDNTETNGPQPGTIHVARRTAGGWEAVGGVLNSLQGDAVSIASVGGVPYVAFQDYSNAGKHTLRVRRWDGLAWQDVGGALNTAGTNALGLSLADVGGAPTVALSELADDGTQTVFVSRFDGTAWSHVGGALNTLPVAVQPVLASVAGQPVVAFLQISDTDVSIQARGYDGTAWTDLSPGVSFDFSSPVHIALAAIGGKPWLAWDLGGVIHVARYDGVWTQIGATLRRDAATTAFQPTLADAGGAHVQWSENDGGNPPTVKAYVSRLGAASAHLHFTVAGPSVAENGGTATLTVARDGDAGFPVRVNWATAPGTAGAGDFTASSGRLDFAAGETSKDISVPITDDEVAEPSETFTVTLSGPAGDADVVAPSTATVTITDDDAVNTQITSGPDGPTTDPKPAFAFVVVPAGPATFECWLDQAQPAPCTSPFQPAQALADGPHTFSVRATQNGVTDPSPATRTFVVDTVDPFATIVVKGTLFGTAFGGTVHVSATGTDPPPGSGIAAVRCAIDPPSAPATYADLPDGCDADISAPGDHKVYAGAIDKAGRTQKPLATRTFTISAAPDTTITSGPTGTVWNAVNAFGFTSTVAGSTFRCSLDDGPYGPCTSPYITAALAPGAHVFRVRAISPGGQQDPTPAERTFAVHDSEFHQWECAIQPFLATGAAAVYGSDPYRCELASPGVAMEDCGRTTVCKRIDNAACPSGALCTVTTKAEWFDADHNVWWYVSADDTKGWIKDCTPNWGGDRCVATDQDDYLGPSATTFADCYALNLTDAPELRDEGSGPPPGKAELGPGSVRRLICTASVRVAPAPVLASAGNGAAVAVLVPSAGTLSVATPGGGRRAVIASSVRRTVSRAGVVKVTPRLPRAAKRRLKRTGALKLALRVRFTPPGGTAIAVKRRVVLSVRRKTRDQLVRRCRRKACRG